MDKKRYEEWIDSSQGIVHAEMLLIGDIQGLGLIDSELIEEKVKQIFTSPAELILNPDFLKRNRHMTLSRLWVLGAYEFVRLMDELLSNRIKEDIFFKRENPIKPETMERVKVVKRMFEEIRVPLVKFHERHNNELYSGINSNIRFDEDKGIGWIFIFVSDSGVKETLVYRKDLADSLLELLKIIKKDVFNK